MIHNMYLTCKMFKLLKIPPIIARHFPHSARNSAYINRKTAVHFYLDIWIVPSKSIYNFSALFSPYSLPPPPPKKKKVCEELLSRHSKIQSSNEQFFIITSIIFADERSQEAWQDEWTSSPRPNSPAAI